MTVVTFRLDLKRTPFSGMFIDTSEVPPITATLKTADPPSLKVTVPLPAPTPHATALSRWGSQASPSDLLRTYGSASSAPARSPT